MKVYIHSYKLDTHIFAFLYGTSYFAKYFEYAILRNSVFVNTNESNLEKKYFSELEADGLIFDEDYKLFREEGIHIFTQNRGYDFYETNINENPNCYYYLISKVDLECLGDILTKSKLGFISNLRILSSTYPKFNTIFDLGYQIRYQIASGILTPHFDLVEYFESIPKKYRLDLSVRNILFKKERLDLLQSLYDLNLKNVKLSIDGHFKRIVDYSKANIDTLNIRNEHIDDLNKLANMPVLQNENLIQNNLKDAMYKMDNGCNLINKPYSVTLTSDISILFESAANHQYKENPIFSNHITEKTLDNLIVGKPLIMCSELIYDFFTQLGLDTYEDIIGINYKECFIDDTLNMKPIIDVVTKINGMNDLEYTEFFSKLKEKALNNKKIVLDAIYTNTLFNDIITLKHFK